MPKPLAELRAILGEVLVEAYLPEAGCTEDQWASFERAIPYEWALAIQDISKGRIKLSDWANVIHPPRSLPKRLRAGKVNVDMNASHRLAISEGADEKDDFRKTIRKAKPRGFTQNGLAKALGISNGLLSLYRKGDRPIPVARALKVQQLTGWPADRAHWPGGIVSGT